MKDRLIVISGGMDSVTLLHQYSHYIDCGVNFNYGSKHNHKEVEYAKLHCKKFNIQLVIINLPFIDKYFQSNLLKNGGEIPEGHYEDEVMKKTVVPFRNGIMLSIAAGIAESKGLNAIMIANHAGDHAIYPDCRVSFITAFSIALREGTYGKIKLKSPYLNVTKRGIAEMGRKINIDYSETWSCYKGLDKHCGKCGTCIERKEALKGFDNTIYMED